MNYFINGLFIASMFLASATHATEPGQPVLFLKPQPTQSLSMQAIDTINKTSAINKKFQQLETRRYDNEIAELFFLNDLRGIRKRTNEKAVIQKHRTILKGLRDSQRAELVGQPAQLWHFFRRQHKRIFAQKSQELTKERELYYEWDKDTIKIAHNGLEQLKKKEKKLAKKELLLEKEQEEIRNQKRQRCD